MKTSGRKVAIPNRDELLQRLRNVFSDETVEQIYLAMAEYAGQELSPELVILLLRESVVPVLQRQPKMMQTIYLQLTPKWIDVLVSDPEVNQEIKDEYHAAYVETGRNQVTGMPRDINGAWDISDIP